MDYWHELKFILLLIVIMTVMLWPYRPRKKPPLGSLDQLRSQAMTCMREYVHDTGDPSYSFNGLQAEVVDQDESVATLNAAVIDYSHTFFLRNIHGEYFMLLYRPGEKPYVKHMEHRIARVKLKTRYVPPLTEG